eukprot:10887731-Ditylum_brightwellii.AAC.1
MYKGTAESAGPSSAWVQQWQALKEKGVEKPNPWKQFTTGLCANLEEIINKGNEVVLALDTNEGQLEQ